MQKSTGGIIKKNDCRSCTQKKTYLRLHKTKINDENETYVKGGKKLPILKCAWGKSSGRFKIVPPGATDFAAPPKCLAVEFLIMKQVFEMPPVKGANVYPCTETSRGSGE